MVFGPHLKAPCQFEAGQVTDGRVILLCTCEAQIIPCAEPESFEGLTEDSELLFTLGSHVELSCLPKAQRSFTGMRFAFLVNQMYVVKPTTTGRREKVHVGLNNFEFVGTEPFTRSGAQFLALPLVLQCQEGSQEVRIVPCEGYPQIVKRLHAQRGVEVTAELELLLDEEEELHPVMGSVMDWCRILSVARGTRVMPAYMRGYSAEDECLLESYSRMRISSYTPMPLIDDRWGDETKAFVESALKTYRKRREQFHLDTGPIDGYLDAKLEADHIEMRGVKLVVVMEMLVTKWLKYHDGRARRSILDSGKAKELKNRLKNGTVAFCSQHEVACESAEHLQSKLGSINDLPFRSKLEELLQFLDVPLSDEDVRMFVKSRNSLVHTGFYSSSKTKDKCKRPLELSSSKHEFCFLLSFLDRVFLKLMNYSGPYIDWRCPGEPKRQELR